MEKHPEESRGRILAAAKKVFAQKGYSGARIDEIAGEAAVNKALIYYYFKSKEAILNELFTVFFRHSTEMLLDFVERGGFAQNPEENKRKFEIEYLGYLETNMDLLKIIVMESLKSEAGEIPLFKLVDISGNAPGDRMENIKEYLGKNNIEQKQEMVTEFFTGIMPYVCYLVLKDKWCSHFHMTQAELRKCFDKAMEETHEQYHKNRPGQAY
ncbi:MAG: TetR/AcrR family transcriptional regulator [Spirochaetaceae bacterium]|nr:MAG: TetR/AcrR family transcriptional regulator [Spirochaetaceae bacterium]